MADPLQALQQSKQALELGLIEPEDFAAVKTAFLRAQQIKSAVDVGLIKAEDYNSAKQEFLNSLIDNSSNTSAVLNPAAHSVHISRPVGNGSAVAAQLAPRPPAKTAPTPPVHAPVAVTTSQAPPTAPIKKVSSSSTIPTNIPKVGGVKSKSGGTSMSGIAVAEDATNLFYLIKAKSAYRWALWRVDDAGSQVVIDSVGDPASQYSDFLDALPESDCRYGIFDYQYTNGDGQIINKLVFLNWAPDTARVKSKMMYASTKDFFKGHLEGISVEFQASDLDEISEADIEGAVKALKKG